MQVTDEHGATDTETVTINVTGSNDAPVITGGGDTSGSVQEDTVSQATGELAAVDPDNGADPDLDGAGRYVERECRFPVRGRQPSIARNGNLNFFVDEFSDGNPPPTVPAGTTTAAWLWRQRRQRHAGGRRPADHGQRQCRAVRRRRQPRSVRRAQRHPAHQYRSATPNAGLRTDDNFTASAVYDLILPDSPRESYGLRLTDRHIGGDGTPPDQPGDDVIDIRLQMNLSGNLFVQLREVDFVADTNTIIEQVAFNAPVGADQIRFNLTHNASNVGAVVGSFDYLSGGVMVGSHTFTNVGQIFGTETAGSPVMTRTSHGSN